MPAPLRTYPIEVFPPERQRRKDPVTGADLLFITTHPARDLNLSFHERSFLAGECMVLFISEREQGGWMGYLFATGERCVSPRQRERSAALPPRSRVTACLSCAANRC